MGALLFEYRGLLVASIFIGLIVAFIAATYYGRRVIRTERTDAVFGNPSRADGGWYWVVTGVCSILIFWFYFSWDAARAFFPRAANELCQVAKLNFAINPVRTLFPLDQAYLRGTSLLTRDHNQLNRLAAQVDADVLNFSAVEKSQALAIIAAMRETLRSLAVTEYLEPDTQARIDEQARRIRALSTAMRAPDYPGQPTVAQLAQAQDQLRWGDSGNEIPIHPATARGYQFAAAAAQMKTIAADFAKISNKNSYFAAQIHGLSARIKNFRQLTEQPKSVDESATPALVAARAKFVKNLNKVLKRIDDGAIFPPQALNAIEQALVELDEVQQQEQGGLRHIDTWLLPGGQIIAGTSSCSEQGSGRWLPKPADTLRTLARISNPAVGYKGFPLLWFKYKPVAEMIGFIVPDWLAALVPGEYPRHGENGEIRSNFKSKVHDFATGNYASFSIPIPTGHIWDSLMRVLAGLFFGIIAGVPLGLFMGLSRFSKGFFDPLIELYRPVPPLAWAPLILTIFGIQDDGKIFLLFMVAFAIMVISAKTGATGTQLSKIHAAHSLGATNRQIIRRVILPNSLPEILTGIRIAIGVCWGTLVAAEMLAGTTGIGFVENVARKQSDYEIIWTTILILGLLGLCFDLIMRWVIERTIPWRGKG